MINNSVQIDRYLQNEMTEADKAAFELQLTIDTELQQELAIQRLVIQAAFDAGLKAEFGKVIRHKVVMKKITIVSMTIFLGAISLFVYKFRDDAFIQKPNADKSSQVVTSDEASHIAPFISIHR
jgi:hypothetical protein